jgi:murein DD-endopeptidase MepM/ murein hydrolase activator NlpD
MSDKRKPFPQFNAFRPFVVDELRRRKNTEIPTPIVAPFVRFTSCMEDEAMDYVFFSLGLHGFDNPDGPDGSNIFDLTYGTRREVVGHAYSRSKDPGTGIHNKKLIFADDISPNVDSFKPFFSPTFGYADAVNAVEELTKQQLSKIPNAAHPIPGITGVSIIRRGLGQPLIATVKWQCYNQGQLEFLRNHFLCTGNYVILEIGNQFSDKQIKNVLPFRQGHAAVWNNLLYAVGAVGSPDQLLKQRGREYIIEAFNKVNDGNYDFIVGVVSNFQIDLESETGIYKCTTKIVSQGENIWGLSINRTFVDQVTPEDHNITTIRDYFEEGRFQLFIESSLKNNASGITRQLGTAWKDGSIVEQPSSLSKVDQNPSDYAFVSWDFMTKDLLDDMLSTIKNPAIKEEIKHYAQLKTVLPDDYVGYHPLLRSAEPETMLLINSTLDPKVIANFTSTSLFSPKPNVEGGRAGKLNEGVWINTGCIRESFLVSNDLFQAFSLILSRMNRSVGGYWDLRLFWDDENTTYKVVDHKYGTQHRNEKFYMFNVGGAGECLSIEFESAFPPELVTQMNLVSMYQSLDPKDQALYKEKFPLIGSTSAHAFLLNWTHLKDGLRDKITQWRNRNYPMPSQPAAPISTRTDLATQTLITQPDATGIVPSTVGNENRPAANKVTSNLPKSNTPDNTTISPQRNSVSAPSSTSTASETQQRKLSTRIMPVQGRISSEFSPARVGPTDGVVRAHKGIDIAAQPGTPIVASMDGTVIISTFSDSFGNYITLDHGDGIKTRYGHMQTRLVQVGSRVRQGQQIGTVGSTGRSTGPHLHYEIIVNGEAVDPKDVTRSFPQPSSNNTIGDSDAGFTSTPPSTGPVKPPAQNTVEQQKKTEEFKREATELRRAEVSRKFGNNILNLIADHLGDMVNHITKDGYVASQLPNQFVSPFPTTTSIAVEIQGIAGISIGDGFFVDKIPFMFQKHGVFQVTEVIDNVSERGWRTTIRGYFKMLWYDGKGGAEVIT